MFGPQPSESLLPGTGIFRAPPKGFQCAARLEIVPFAKRRPDSAQEQRPGQASWWHGREDVPVPPGRAAAGPWGSVHILLPQVEVGGGLEFLFPHRHPSVTDASGLGHAESHSLTAKEPIISGGGGREAQRGQQIAFLLLRVRDVWSSPPLPADHHLAVSFIQLRTDTGQDASVLFVA